jgi:hypothetical protein
MGFEIEPYQPSTETSGETETKTEEKRPSEKPENGTAEKKKVLKFVK